MLEDVACSDYGIMTLLDAESLVNGVLNKTSDHPVWLDVIVGASEHIKVAKGNAASLSWYALDLLLKY